MTEKLYYSEPYCRTFSARVLSCEEEKKGFAVILDRTAFYPEGGGQPCDLGNLNGIPVTEVHERQGDIVHLCTQPIAAGEAVSGTIDWQRRFDNMQNHSGEHVVSGFVHQKYGYDNVGFHMGSDFITIDFNGMIDEAGLREIERRANEAVWQDIPLEIGWPSPEELKTLPFRSKKELTGPVRIVSVPGVDLCACCGTHVSRTGEIGVIQLFSCVKFHSGVRIEMLCGRRCLEYLEKLREQNHGVSVRLSAKPLETAAAVERLNAAAEQYKLRISGLESRVFAAAAEKYAGQGKVILFEDKMEADSLRKLCDVLSASCGGNCYVFAGSDAEGWKYCLASPDEDLRPLCKELNGAFSGRGGGKPGNVQGSLTGTERELRAFLTSRT